MLMMFLVQAVDPNTGAAMETVRDMYAALPQYIVAGSIGAAIYDSIVLTVFLGGVTIVRSIVSRRWSLSLPSKNAASESRTAFRDGEALSPGRESSTSATKVSPGVTKPYADPVFCITRLIVGLMFACHGGQKVLGFPPGGHGMPTETLGIVGAWIELVGGFLIAFGFLTRLAAFIASGEMAVGYFKFHLLAGGFFAAKGAPVNGESAVFYCWFFFFVVFYGAGRWSIDALISKGKAATSTPAAT